MLTEQRHEIILQLVRNNGSITVTEIKDALGISESTIRRDLTTLDQEGKLTKVFGGAVALETTLATRELSVSQKALVNIPRKQLIGKYAASLIEPRDFIFLDAGTTTECMIDFITDKSVTIVTNAVSHARKLASAGFHVIILGGELKGTTEAIIGSQAILSLQNYYFTKGFFGTNGISLTRGLTTPDEQEALIKKTAMKQCIRKIVLADQKKFDDNTFVTFASFQETEIITDCSPGAKYKECKNIVVLEKTEQK